MPYLRKYVEVCLLVHYKTNEIYPRSEKAAFRLMSIEEPTIIHTYMWGGVYVHTHIRTCIMCVVCDVCVVWFVRNVCEVVYVYTI